MERFGKFFILLIVISLFCGATRDNHEVEQIDSLHNGERLSAKKVKELLPFLDNKIYEEIDSVFVNILESDVNNDGQSENLVIISAPEHRSFWEFFIIEDLATPSIQLGSSMLCCEGVSNFKLPNLNKQANTIFAHVRTWGTCMQGENIEGYQHRDGRLLSVISVINNLMDSYCGMDQDDYPSYLTKLKNMTIEGDRIQLIYEFSEFLNNVEMGKTDTIIDKVVIELNGSYNQPEGRYTWNNELNSSTNLEFPRSGYDLKSYFDAKKN